MATNTVTTSIVVQFSVGAGAAGALVVEIDDREPTEGGLNGGKTSFLPGDTVYLLKYQSNNVVLDASETSLGSLSSGSSVSISKTEDVTFAGETEASLRYPVTGSFSYTWIGASNGTVSVVNQTTLRIPTPPPGQFAVGIARCTYVTTGMIYRLSHSDPGYPEYGIVVFFAGHTE